MTVVLAGSAVIVLALWSLMTFKPVPGAATSWYHNIVAAILVVIFGFLFVTVSSRICGLIGTSANPVSGMTIATLMATCALFLAAGWTAPAYGALALTIGGVVCIAAANAGATSQDLKTGFLVGATPSYQQLGLFAGVLASSFVIGGTLIAMNKGLEKFVPVQNIAITAGALPEGVVVQGTKEHDGRSYTLLNAIGSPTIPEGKYLQDPQTGVVAVQWIQGIGSENAAAPQARLMSVVINGILNQKLPWGLVLLGVFLVIAVELLGIRSLSFAVGSYLNIGTTAAIFCGGVVKWLAERGQQGGRGGRGQPRRPLRLRPDRGRRHRGSAGHWSLPARDPGRGAEGRAQVRAGPPVPHQQHRRRDRVRPAGLLPLLLRAEAAGRAGAAEGQPAGHAGRPRRPVERKNPGGFAALRGR